MEFGGAKGWSLEGLRGGVWRAKGWSLEGLRGEDWKG